MNLLQTFTIGLIFYDNWKGFKSVFISFLPRYSIVSFSSFGIWYRTLQSIFLVTFGPYNAFPNGEWRFSIWVNVTFLTYSTCIGRSESDMMGKKWMCATVLWRNWSLVVNILGDIAKHCWISSAIKTYSWKLKMVYWKLKMYSWKLNTVYWKLKTKENNMLTSVYGAHKNKDKRVIGIPQLC